MTIFMNQCLDQFSSERLPPIADWIRFRDQQQNLLGGAQENPLKQERVNLEPDCSRIPREHCPQNQLSRVNKGSERLKQQSWQLHEFVLGSLQLCSGCLVCGFCGIPNNGSRDVSDSFPCFATPYLLLAVLIQP